MSNKTFTVFLLVSWFIAGTVGTVANKYSLNLFGFPLLLTACIITFGCIIDFIVVKHRGIHGSKFDLKIAFMLFPVVVSVLFSKTLTFIAFGSIPVSLALTVKAASPLFSVLMERIVLKKTPSKKACVALVPIAIGVTMSSISEVQFAFYGMIAAIVSTLMVVCQTMYTKRCLETIQELDPLLLHLYTSTTAMLFVLPYLIYSAGSYYLAYGGMATENLQALDVVRSLIDPFSVISFLQPMLIVLLGVGCVYIQNMSSLAFLHATSTTSHQVATTCNKFTVIVSTIFIFHEPASTTNVLGFVIAGVGFLCYTTATEEKKIKDFSLGVEEIFVDQDNILPLQTKQSKVDIEMGTIVKTKISPKSVEPIVEMEKDE